MKYCRTPLPVAGSGAGGRGDGQGSRIWRATAGNCRMARKQLQDIRQRRREGTQKPTWNKPLRTPALALLALMAVLCHGDGDLEMNWKYFCGACLVVGAALLKAGAPLLAIVAGIALAALGNFLRHRASSARTGSTAARAR